MKWAKGCGTAGVTAWFFLSVTAQAGAWPLSDSAFLVNDDVSGGCAQANPHIAAGFTGDRMVVAWIDYRYAERDVYFQLFDNSTSPPQPIGSNQEVNTGASSAYVYEPRVAMDGQGRFVILWIDHIRVPGGIIGQRFDESGTSVGERFVVNEQSRKPGESWTPGWPEQVFSDNGSLWVVWPESRFLDTATAYPYQFRIWCQRFDSLGNREGGNFRVDDHDLPSYKYPPSIAIDHSGRAVVVWTDARNYPTSPYFQLLDASGSPLGPNTRISTEFFPEPALNVAGHSSVAMTPSGEFIVAWDQCVSTEVAVFAQKFGATGDLLTIPVKVSHGSVSSPCSSNPGVRIVVAPVGVALVSWSFGYQMLMTSMIEYDVNQSTVGSDLQTSAHAWNASGKVFECAEVRGGPTNTDVIIYGFDQWGYASSGDVRVHDDVASSHQMDSRLAGNSRGQFVVAWRDFRVPTGYAQIYCQPFADDAGAVGPNVQVSLDSGFVRGEDPDVAMAGDGSFAVVWEDLELSEERIYCRRFAAGGAPQGMPFRVNEASSRLLDQPRIAADSAGNLAIVWADNWSWSGGVYVQRLTDAGSPIGGNVRIDDDSALTAKNKPDIAMSEDGRWAAVWQDMREGAAGLYYQFFSKDGTPLGFNRRLDTTKGAHHAARRPSIAMNRHGQTAVAWLQWEGISYVAFALLDETGAVVAGPKRAGATLDYQPLDGPSCVISEDRVAIIWSGRLGVPGPGPAPRADVFIDEYTFSGERLFDTRILVGAGDNEFNHRAPAAAAVAGEIATSWTDNRRGQGWDIFAQRVAWSEPVSVTEDPSDTRPEDVALLSNYPNPFNARTAITVRLSRPEAIDLSIFNALGRRVRTVVAAALPAGAQTLMWDGRDEQGRPSPSGVYFARLEIQDEAFTRKMLLLR